MMNNMKQYQWYEVEECYYFSEFLDIITQKYGDMVVFENNEKRVKYSELKQEVQKYTSFFSNYTDTLFVINIKDCFVFTCVYFAAIISGNIAVLCDEKEAKNILNGQKYVCINDSYANIIRTEDSHAFVINNRKDKCCTVVCSSGTTSQKKGVMLSQYNLLSDTFAGMRCYEYPKGAVYLNIIPYTHLFGIVADLLGPLYSGGCICYGNKMDFFDNLRKYKPTNLNLPPALVNSIYKLLIATNDFEYATGGSLKKVMCAGAKMNDNVNDVFGKYGMRVYAAYGLTECSPCVSLSRDEFYKAGSCGMVMPCNNVEIIDGEIVVSGTNVMLGYFNDINATNKVLIDGKLYTGDLGNVDKDNFLYVTGRKNNLIVFSDGTKIMPEEVENEINCLTMVEESLVTTSDKTDCINICVVITMEAKIEIVERDLKELLKKHNLRHRLNKLVIRYETLERNQLGKIVRRKEFF